MSRMCKRRIVCMVPQNREFHPRRKSREKIVLSVEQVEALRLTDYEGLDQHTAAAKMGISRGTFQRILYLARQKTADGLISGKNILISGGNYTLTECVCSIPVKCRCCRFIHNTGHENNESRSVVK